MYIDDDRLSYDNPIVGFEHTPDRAVGLNLIMLNGNRTGLPWHPLYQKQDSLIPLGAEVRKAVIYYYSPTTQLGGITLYDAEGVCLLKVGKT